jgi:hypothetical protein
VKDPKTNGSPNHFYELIDPRLGGERGEDYILQLNSGCQE